MSEGSAGAAVVLAAAAAAAAQGEQIHHPGGGGRRVSMHNGGHHGHGHGHGHGGRRVFVVLDKGVNEATLEGAFDQCAGVETVELKRDGDGRSRGFAYVTFGAAEEASAAASAMDGAELPLGSGRRIKVMMAEEPGSNGSGGGGGGGGRSGGREDTRRENSQRGAFS